MRIIAAFLIAWVALRALSAFLIGALVLVVMGDALWAFLHTTMFNRLWP